MEWGLLVSHFQCSKVKTIKGDIWRLQCHCSSLPLSWPLLPRCPSLQPDRVTRCWPDIIVACACFHFFAFCPFCLDCISHVMPASDNPTSFNTQLKCSPLLQSLLLYFFLDLIFFFDTVVLDVREALVMLFCENFSASIVYHFLSSFPTHSGLLQGGSFI